MASSLDALEAILLAAVAQQQPLAQQPCQQQPQQSPQQQQPSLDSNISCILSQLIINQVQQQLLQQQQPQAPQQTQQQLSSTQTINSNSTNANTNQLLLQLLSQVGANNTSPSNTGQQQPKTPQQQFQQPFMQQQQQQQPQFNQLLAQLLSSTQQNSAAPTQAHMPANSANLLQCLLSQTMPQAEPSAPTCSSMGNAPDQQQALAAAILASVAHQQPHQTSSTTAPVYNLPQQMQQHFQQAPAATQTIQASAYAAAAPSMDVNEPQQEDGAYPMAGIEYPGPHDCLFGRGGGASNHIGNINFRMMVEKHKKRYADATKFDKPKVAEEVVSKWQAMTPPGRFLMQTNPSEGAMSKWHDVGNKLARRKCAQALREKPTRCRAGDGAESPAAKKAKTSA